jgi:hypothetical protein
LLLSKFVQLLKRIAETASLILLLGFLLLVALGNQLGLVFHEFPDLFSFAQHVFSLDQR